MLDSIEFAYGIVPTISAVQQLLTEPAIRHSILSDFRSMGIGYTPLPAEVNPEK